jgi:hypothetical protein
MKLFVFITMMIAVTAGGDTIGWRTDGTGRYPDANPPLQWSSTQNVVWKTPMPAAGNATPVIVGERIFVCAEPDLLLCFNAQTGKIIWQKRNAYQDLNPPKRLDMPRRHNTNGYSSPTPVTNSKNVFVVFGNGIAACYDLRGNRRWIKYIDSPKHGWGHSASPLLVGDKLIVMINDMRALNPANGSPLWRIEMSPRWGSPIATRIGKTDVIITPTGRIVRAGDGRVLHQHLGSLNYNTPIVDGDKVYFIDGERQTRAYQLPQQAGDSVQVKTLWSSRIAKNRYYASPLLHDGVIYAINMSGRFSAIDAASGEVLYKKKLQLGGTVYPSIALAGEKLYVSSDSGQTFVIEPGRHYKIASKNKLGAFRSSPVFVGNKMYIRTMSHLYCISEDRRTARAK